MKVPVSPETILVRAPNWIGDQVLAFPFFYYLRKAYPKAKIVSVCVPWVADVQFFDLIDDVYVLPRFMGRSLMQRVSTLNENAKELRSRGRWDLAISLPNSLSAAWLMYRCGALCRRGYKVDGRGLLLNDGLAWDPRSERHRAQAYVDLLPDSARELVTRPVKEFWTQPPENELDPPEWGELTVFDAAKAWPKASPLEPPKEPYWVFAPGATAESRRWPVEYMTLLAHQIADQKGWKGIVVGGPSEAPVAARLCDDPSLRLEDWTARGSVSSLWKLFRNAQFTVTNESGLAHVASLCGSFVQIVCGAADPRRTRPLGPGKVQVAINPVDCWPCERNTCSEMPKDQLKCLKGIQPDLVWEEIKRVVR